MKKAPQFEVTCPECAKKVKSRQAEFCPECGHGLYTPKITRKWSNTVLAIIFVSLMVLYLIYLALKPTLYSYLDLV